LSRRRRVYLDHNATAPTRPEAVAAMVEALRDPANASSVHGFGREARRRLEAARRRLAEQVNADPAGIVFTSGGTEANNLALHGVGGPTLVSAIEHASVLDPVPQAERVPVGEDGVVDLPSLERKLMAGRPRLVSVMLANNETGVVQPVSEVAELAHRHGALLHVDAAQALGRMPVDMCTTAADLMTLSAHKMGGPPGVGALAIRPDITLLPRQFGGAQEGRRRGGTENLPAILGWVAALDAHQPDEPVRMRSLRDALERAVRVHHPSVTILGRDSFRLPNTTCLLAPGLDSSTQLMVLDLAGVAVSSGSACSSGKVGPSHVLKAMGLGDTMARCAIRISLGWNSTEDDVDSFVAAWCSLVDRKRHVAHDLASASAATT
jgi:cysteine desulfurase